MKKLKLYYCNEPNFGDLLNIDVMAGIFGLAAIYTPKHKCEMVGIGSLLDGFLDQKAFRFSRLFTKLTKPVHVWGSGFLWPAGQYSKFRRPLIVHAVRGYVSLKRLEQLNCRILNNVAIGDPGLLAPLLLRKPVGKQYKIGIIPHYIEYGLPLFKKIANAIKDAKIINVALPVMDVIKDIARCELVLSSSLHGLAAADSLGIPNQWAIASDLLCGGSYKFLDYYSGYGITAPQAIDLRVSDFTGVDVAAIANNYKIQARDVEQKRQQLVNSFPQKFL